jgi:hypothetical protein
VRAEIKGGLKSSRFYGKAVLAPAQFAAIQFFGHQRFQCCASPVRISGSSVTGNGQYRKPTLALFLFGLLLFFFWFVASTHASSIPRFLEKVSFSII